MDHPTANENGAALTGQVGDGELSPPAAANTPDTFDELLGASEGPEAPLPERGGRGLMVVTIGAALLGVGVLVGTLTLPPDTGGRADAVDVAPAPAPATTSNPVDTTEPAVELTREAQSGVTALVDSSWAARIAESFGIPERAMLAYAGAELRLAEELPACHLGWNTLAAIGQVESGHGTIDGGRIDDEGHAAPRIFGPTLNVAEYDIIGDTDNGVLDGDAEWDRAVGPLQFLPSTWLSWGTDGSGDSIADPQNLDDAALTAGRYLCEAGGDLSGAQNWLNAIWAYNGTNEYAVAVSEAARHYARG